MTLVRFSLKYACTGMVLAAAYMAGAQSGISTEKIPLPDPGYGLYYHDAAGVPNVAARWGYHDGWTDGRHDRNHGDADQAQQKDHYLKPPDHGDAYRALADDPLRQSSDDGGGYNSLEDHALPPPDQSETYSAQENDRYQPQEDDDTARVLEKERYRTPPNHGIPSGALRDRYLKAYRTAYVHGYEHGSR